MKIGDTVIKDEHGGEISLSNDEMRELYQELKTRFGGHEYYPVWVSSPTLPYLPYQPWTTTEITYVSSDGTLAKAQ